MADQEPAWQFPGPRWWKFDLHTHSPASVDYGKGPGQASLRMVEPRDWLLAFMRAHIDCVAVTDHNTGGWIDRLQDALRKLEQETPTGYRPLKLFPGVEITANGSIHILAVLDAHCQSKHVEALLGAVSFEGTPGASDAAAKSSSIEVVEAICEAGGVPILAHVDGPAGAWELKGNSLAPLLDLEGLFAVEVVDPSHERPQIYRDRKLHWAEVVGSDSHNQASVGKRYTWIKMAGPSLDGLRLALLDGGLSIRRSDAAPAFNPLAVPKDLIEAIEVEEARFMGRGSPTIMQFSPWLNALIGGRGAGKSTILHALRLASGRQAELSDLEERTAPRATFDEFIRVSTDRQDRGALTPKTTTRWLVKRDDVRYRLHWQQNPNAIVVEYLEDDKWIRSPSQLVSPQRFPLRLFSQGQIAELAGKNQALLRIVDEGAHIEEKQRELDDACARLTTLRASVRQVERRLRREESLVAQLHDCERKLERHEEKGSQDILVEYRYRQRQKHELEDRFKHATDAANRIDTTAESLKLADIPSDVFTKEDRGPADVLKKIRDAVDDVADSLHKAAEKLRDTTKWNVRWLGRARKEAWTSAVEDATSHYEELVKDLAKEDGTNPDEYSELVEERTALLKDLNALNAEKKERDKLVCDASKQRSAVLRVRRAMTAARVTFLSKALADNRFVHIAIRAYGSDLEAIERMLRNRLAVTNDRFQNDILSEDGDRGIAVELFSALPRDATERREELETRIEDLKDRMEQVCAGHVKFRPRFNDYIQRKFKENPGLLDNIITWFPEDELVVEYSPRGDGRGFRPISQASAGQRSAAMLAFLLAHGEEPLVLDQPEDDLDNQLIYELVVQQIRENKLRRQIIIVTHNANIVVNGDADLIHVLRFTKGQCVVGKSGSLEDSKIREEVCQIMEGGREAFARRHLRLGRERHDV